MTLNWHEFAKYPLLHQLHQFASNFFQICFKFFSNLVHISFKFTSNSFQVHFKFVWNLLHICSKFTSNSFLIYFKFTLKFTPFWHLFKKIWFISENFSHLSVLENSVCSKTSPKWTKSAVFWIFQKLHIFGFISVIWQKTSSQTVGKNALGQSDFRII